MEGEQKRFSRTLTSSAADLLDDKAYRMQHVAVLVRNIAGEVRSVNCIVGEKDQCHECQFENNNAAPREGQRHSLSWDHCSQLIQEVSAAVVRDQLTKDLKLPSRGLLELLRDSDDDFGIGDDADASQSAVGTANTNEMIVQDCDVLWGKAHQSHNKARDASNGVSSRGDRGVELLAEEGRGDRGVELLAEEELKIPCYAYVVKRMEFANDIDWGELSSWGTEACEAYVFQQAYERHVGFRNGDWSLTDVCLAAVKHAWEECEEFLDPNTDIRWPVRIGMTDLYVEMPDHDPVRWYYPTVGRYASDENPPIEALPLVKAMLGQYYKNTPEHIAEIMRFLKRASSETQWDSFLDLLGDEELKHAIARDVVYMQVTESCNFHHMKKAPMELQEDVEFAFECLRNARSKFDIALSFCSLRKDGLVRNSVPFAMECVKLFPPNLQYCGPAPLDSRELVLHTVENPEDHKNPCAWYHLVSSRLRGDVEFVIEVIQKLRQQNNDWGYPSIPKQKKVEGLRDILQNTPNSVLQKSDVVEALDGLTEELGIEGWRDF